MPLKMLNVGGGSIWERHLRCFQRQANVVVALCEANKGRRIEVVERYKVADSFSTFDAASQCTWDAAVVCTSANLHVEQSVTLLERASAVLVEKPITIPSNSASSLLVKSQSKTVRVAYLYRSHPAARHRFEINVAALKSAACGQQNRVGSAPT